jgi:hypothetical protein
MDSRVSLDFFDDDLAAHCPLVCHCQSFSCLLLAIPFPFSHLWRIIVIYLSYCMLSYMYFMPLPPPPLRITFERSVRLVLLARCCIRTESDVYTDVANTIQLIYCSYTIILFLENQKCLHGTPDGEELSWAKKISQTFVSHFFYDLFSYEHFKFRTLLFKLFDSIPTFSHDFTPLPSMLIILSTIYSSLPACSSCWDRRCTYTNLFKNRSYTRHWFSLPKTSSL